MSNIVIYTIITLSLIGVSSAMILYFAAQKFKVYEDPRIDDIEKSLPSANCGGCGYAGCRNFADECVKAENLDELYCPVGGNEVMLRVATILGKEIQEQAPKVAVIRCNGAPEFRMRIINYDGPKDCAIEDLIGAGDTACQYGCLGGGDCVAACNFDAIFMNEKTMLPYVVDEQCTACGACVEACPRDIIELRTKQKKDRKIFVSCVSQEKAATTAKACEVGCINCNACFKVCEYDAITMGNNLAFINSDMCKLCRKCIAVCPTGSILEIGFPPRKTPTEAERRRAKRAEKKALKAATNNQNNA